MVVYKKAACLRLEKREYEEKYDALRYARYFIALILNDLLSEKTMFDVMRKYQCTKSFVQQLQQSTSTFVSIVQIFAEHLSWTNLKQLLHCFQLRLHFGIKQELCALIRISILNACRARQLYNDGFTTIASLANGNVQEIERSLQKSVPFQTFVSFFSFVRIDVSIILFSSAAQQLADEQLGQERHDQYCIFVCGRSPLTNAQAAKEIIEEAKLLLQEDLQAMGFGMVIRKAPMDRSDSSDVESDNDEDEDDEETEEEDREEEFRAPKLSSTVTFPSLIDDRNIRIRNAYVDGKHICSEFILMIEHKETIAISCLTKKMKKIQPGLI